MLTGPTLAEIEQHALIGWHGAAIHQALSAVRIVSRNLDLEALPLAALRRDREGFERLRIGCRDERQQGQRRS